MDQLEVVARRESDKTVLAKYQVGGRTVLSGEVEWIFRGEPKLIVMAALALEGKCELVDEHVLTVWFGNSVGLFDIPGVGKVEVRSSKCGEEEFYELLDDLTRVAASLPFSTAGGTLPYDRSVVSEKRILYHLFDYLRRALSDDAPPDRQLIPPLRSVLRDPHRRLNRDRRLVGLDRVLEIDTRAFVDIVTGGYIFGKASGGAAQRMGLTTYLKGHLPLEVHESFAEVVYDIPENRFVKAFVGMVGGVIESMRQEVKEGKTRFERQVLADCQSMERKLDPIASSKFWNGIGRMVHLPAGSTVLQRRAGYKEVFRHFAKMGLASSVPLDAVTTQDLLQAKNIALLYELWCYFKVVEKLTEILGVPKKVTGLEPTMRELTVRWGFGVEWENGTTLLYNETFSRSRKEPWSTYSLIQRPDITLIVPSPFGWVLHILDAKFKVDRPRKAETEDDKAKEKDLDAPIPELEGIVTRGDVGVMHTYRDSIKEAHSAWVLFPGSKFQFYHETYGLVRTVDKLSEHEELEGVGAIPLRPGDKEHTELSAVLRRMLDRAKTPTY